jgi:hypothetical protein
MLILLAACLKPAEVPQASTRASVVTATVVESFDSPEVTGPPDDVLERISGAVAARNLEPVAADAASWSEAFRGRRTTAARLELLAERGGAAVLLVELAPRFSAQVNGRYRWSVEATVTLLPVAHPQSALARELNVPVHLLYAHQQEAEAASEAASVVAREVGAVLNEWVGGR